MVFLYMISSCFLYEYGSNNNISSAEAGGALGRNLDVVYRTDNKNGTRSLNGSFVASFKNSIGNVMNKSMIVERGSALNSKELRKTLSRADDKKDDPSNKDELQIESSSINDKLLLIKEEIHNLFIAHGIKKDDAQFQQLKNLDTLYDEYENYRDQFEQQCKVMEGIVEESELLMGENKQLREANEKILKEADNHDSVVKDLQGDIVSIGAQQQVLKNLERDRDEELSRLRKAKKELESRVAQLMEELNGLKMMQVLYNNGGEDAELSKKKTEAVLPSEILCKYTRECDVNKKKLEEAVGKIDQLNKDLGLKDGILSDQTTRIQTLTCQNDELVKKNNELTGKCQEVVELCKEDQITIAKYQESLKEQQQMFDEESRKDAQAKSIGRALVSCHDYRGGSDSDESHDGQVLRKNNLKQDLAAIITTECAEEGCSYLEDSHCFLRENSYIQCSRGGDSCMDGVFNAVCSKSVSPRGTSEKLEYGDDDGADGYISIKDFYKGPDKKFDFGFCNNESFVDEDASAEMDDLVNAISLGQDNDDQKKIIAQRDEYIKTLTLEHSEKITELKKSHKIALDGQEKANQESEDVIKDLNQQLTGFTKQLQESANDNSNLVSKNTELVDKNKILEERCTVLLGQKEDCERRLLTGEKSEISDISNIADADALINPTTESKNAKGDNTKKEDEGGSFLKTYGMPAIAAGGTKYKDTIRKGFQSIYQKFKKNDRTKIPVKSGRGKKNNNCPSRRVK